MYCRYKRRSLWKGFFISKNLLSTIKYLSLNKKVSKDDFFVEKVSRNFVLYPFLQGRVYEIHNGKFFERFTLRNKMTFYSKIGQYVYLLKMGSTIHLKKTKKSKNFSRKK